MLKGKKIGILANQTSTIGKVHLVDSLVRAGIKINRIFAPEHGFRGEAANGETVVDGRDLATGIQVVSLYGQKLKPKKEDLENLDLIIYDIQDVGVRFYTYLTSLHYLMEACAENNVPLIVLDRPNPNGNFIDGPILDSTQKSIVGMHPIPIVHGMTLGELALMINGEGWLPNKEKCQLTVIPVFRWDHNTRYILPIAPSPNLQTPESVTAYPTMGLFEGTTVSMGRGTDHPFECFGAPWLKAGRYLFVPKNIPGKTINPPFLNDTCRGFLITDFAKNYMIDLRSLYIEWLVLLVQECPDKSKFFNSYFDKLAGTSQLREQLLGGKSETQIRESWKKGLEEFEHRRKPYLLYPYNPEAGYTRD
jgi:uncharacterized protein YbbC (DUF1343 family)